MCNKNEIFEYLIGQLRQQVNSNPYKQQCEDLAHEVQSLKNQLRDASVQIKELQETIKLMNEDFNRATGRGGHLPNGKSYVVGEHGPEQSGRRKEDVQECEHSWIIMPGLFLSEGNPNNVPGSELCCKCGKREWDVKGYKPKDDTKECHHNWRFVNGKAPAVCINCGVAKSSECEHEWQFYGVGFPCMCIKCGLKSPDRQKEDTQECEHDWVLDEKGDYFVCAKCGEQEAELVDCQHINTVGLRKGFAPGFTKKCLDCGAKLK